MVTRGDDDPVLASPAALTPDSSDVAVVDRESVLAAYRDEVSHLLETKPPHLFVYGPRGSGKTLLTRRVLSEERAEHRVVFVSCEEHGSSYAVAVAIANAVDPERDALSHTGHARAAVTAALENRLRNASPTIIVLDDVDAIDAEPVLQTLADAAVHAAIGTICVANGFAVRNDLDYHLRRQFCARELSFTPYDRTVVRRIIRERTDAAFREGAVGPAVIDRCVNLVETEFDGDVGRGIRLFRFVAAAASEDGAKTVTLDHVSRATDRLLSSRIRARLSDASIHRSICLLAVLRCGADGDDGPRIDAIYDRYRDRCVTADVEPISKRAVHDHLRALRDADLVSVSSHRSGEPGHYYRYRLEEPRAAVRLALADDGILPAKLRSDETE